MAYEYRSSFQRVGDDDLSPEIIYYNGDIINNQTTTPELYDPQDYKRLDSQHPEWWLDSK